MYDEDSKAGRLLTEILKCEASVWDALVSGDKMADINALHSDFLGVYPDGFSTKEDDVGRLAEGPTVSSYELSNPRIRTLGKSTSCCHIVLASPISLGANRK